MKIFVDTIAQQEEEINGLKSAIKAITLESAAAHNNIKAWTMELLNEAQKSLIVNINESKAQIQNFVYNVQGFEDSGSNDVLLAGKILKPNEISVPLSGRRAIDGRFQSVM